MGEKTIFNRISDALDKFFYSPVYLVLIPTIGIAGFALSREIEAMLAVGLFMMGNLLFSKDILPSFLALAIMAMIPLARHNDAEYFVPFFRILYPFLPEDAQSMVDAAPARSFLSVLAPAMPLGVVAAFLARFFIHPFKLRIGRFFYPTLLVAFAITFGGLFYLDFESYFSFPTIFYVFTLGVGMIITYFFLEAYLPRDNPRMADYFAKMMVAVGVMGILMLVSGYYHEWERISTEGPGRIFQWRNNLSNNLLMAMPFAFYLSLKSKYFIPYFTIGVLQFVVLVLSYSRGGIIFGTLLFPMLVASTFLLAKQERFKILFNLVLVFAAVYLLFDNHVMPFSDVLSDIVQRVSVSREESRARMFFQAVARFRAYPIFGTGLADEVHYNPGQMSMNWYHSTVSQVIGSMGLIGIIAYTYQELIRLKTLIESKNRFNLFAFFALLGFGGYSLVNVGYFVAIPFVTMLLFMFMISERYNKILEADETLYEQDRIDIQR